MSKEFYSVKEFAKILGMSTDRIYEYLRADYLHGSRATKRSAWRIPDAELQRFKGTSLVKSGAQTENKSASWSEYLELAIQLQNSLSGIGFKDWSIWGLPDTGKPPQTSEAGLRLWIDRGELAVNLSVESDKRFPLFITRLKASFTEFESYDRWRKSLISLVRMCWDMAHEIKSKAEAETGLFLSPYPPIGKGHLINVPKYIYEFALDKYACKGQPVLEILENDPKHCWVVPGGLPNYALAMGSKDEMEKCREATISLAVQYAKDERMGKIVAKARQVKDQTAPFQSALSAVIEKATGGS